MVISHYDRCLRRIALLKKAREGATIPELVREFQLGDAYIRQMLKIEEITINSGDSANVTRAEQRERKKQVLADAAKGCSLNELSSKYRLSPSTISNYCSVQTAPKMRIQTIICVICGDTHSVQQKYRRRPVCDKPKCKLEFRNANKDNHSRYKRDLEIVQYSAGGTMTLQEIANKYDVSRERIRQIILNHGGKAHSKRVKTSNCGMCEKEMTCVGRLPNKFCSSECREANRERSNNRIAKAHRKRAEENDSKWARTIEKTYTCDGCGCLFERSNYIKSITENRYSPKDLANKKIYCDQACYIKNGNMFGVNSAKETKTITYDFIVKTIISIDALEGTNPNDLTNEVLEKLKQKLQDQTISVQCKHTTDEQRKIPKF